MARPLEGIRVLDLTWVLSGPYSTMILSDLGAEVIKVERRIIGDVSRGNGPYVNGISTYFFSINRGKKSMTLDLRSAKGKEILLQFVKRVDVLTENFVPGTLENLGLGYETLREHNPGLIYAATSGFGKTGAEATKPAFDIIAQARSGMMSITGEEGGRPVRSGVSIGDIAAGLYMTIGILAAIHERSKTGLGQMIDISMLDCQIAIMENAFIRYLNLGEVPRALGTRHPVITPFQAFPTKDRGIVIAMGGGYSRWDLFCAAIDRIDLIDDERFQSNVLRNNHVAELEPIISEALLRKTTDEWMVEFEAIGLSCSRINSLVEAAEDPQILSRQMFAEVPVEGVGTMRIVNTPIKMSRTPCSVEKRAPNLGEDTREWLMEFLDLSESEVDALVMEEVI